MKFVLMVAAGIAVGLTVAVAVLIQVIASLLQALERLAPLLVAVGLVVVALLLFRRRSRSQSAHSDPVFPQPALPPPAAPVSSPASAPATASVDHQAPYLRWGPPSADADLLAAPVGTGTGAPRRPAPARRHHSRPAGGSRP